MNGDQWQRLDAIFAEAAGLPLAERDAFVARACEGNEELRREALSLVGVADQSSEFMAQPAIERLARAMAGDGWSLRPGDRLGAYTVRELIGAGGAGEVWRATDERLHRDVAIKVLLPHLSGDPTRVRRFIDEARTAGSLNHSNILSLYDIGEHGGAPFIVSELVEGETLRARLKKGPMPVADAVSVARQIARGLAAAHGRGIVHCDLKPDNVFLRSDGGVKLLDFGLAKLQLPEREDGASVPAGVIAGTAGYMAPEQLTGAAVDARADLFALGATLHEMLTGRRAFGGASTMESLHKIVGADPERIVDDAVPPGLAAIIRRLLEKSPADRFQSAADVLEALEHVTASPHPPWSRAIIPAAVAIVALGLGIPLTMLWRGTAPAASAVAIGAGGRPAIALLAFDDATGSADMAWLSRGVPSMLLTDLSQTGGLEIVGQQRLQDAARHAGHGDIGGLDRGQAADVARRAGAGALVSGTIYKAGTGLRIDAQLEDLASGRILAARSVRGDDVFALVGQLSAQIRTSVGFGDAADVRRLADVSSPSLAAYRLYVEGMDAAIHLRFPEAQQRLEQAVAADPEFAEAHLRLAIIHHAMGRSARRREHLDRAARHATRLGPRQRQLLEIELARDARDFTKLAALVDETIERFPDSVDTYVIASVLYDPNLGAFPDLDKLLAIAGRGAMALPASTEMRNGYGYALLTAGRFAEALAEFEAYARLAPREPNPLDGMGDAYLLLGEPERAVQSYSRALAIDPTFGSRNGRAYALGVLGRYDAAIADQAPFPHVRAMLLARAGRYREAFDALAAGIGQAGANQNPQIAAGLSIMSAALALERRDYSRALREASRFGQLVPREDTGPRRLGTIAAETIAGLAELGAGRRPQARARFEAQRRTYRSDIALEKWWHHVFAGELALAAGDISGAAAAYEAGEPPRPFFLTAQPGPVVVNNLAFRDGLARIAEARGDVAGAIAKYRELLAPGPRQKWVSVLDPRYVLQLARLLDRAGDRDAAHAEYRRFLDLWNDADGNLPELAEARRALAGGPRAR